MTGTTDTVEQPHAIIIGGGLAGLTCARVLRQAGLQCVIVEQHDSIGGRLSSFTTPDGFLIDQGFQVIFEAYPALRRHVNLRDIPHSTFSSAVAIWTGRRRIPLGHPLFAPRYLPRNFSAPLLTLEDRLSILCYGIHTVKMPWQHAAEADLSVNGSSRSIHQELKNLSLSNRCIERIFRPFWGGITLDPSLSTAAGVFRFTFKMLMLGRAIMPASGVAALPRALATSLPPSSIRLGSKVDTLVRESGRVTGVMIHGMRLSAPAVIVATDAPNAHTLTKISNIPVSGRGCITVYLTHKMSTYRSPELIVDGTRRLKVNHVVRISAVQPSVSPPDRHLAAAVLVHPSVFEMNDQQLEDIARVDGARLLGFEPSAVQPIAIVRTPFAQFEQPPGIYARLPGPRTGIPGLYLSGEYLVDSSINGAITSGEMAAKAVIEDFRASGPIGRSNQAGSSD